MRKELIERLRAYASTSLAPALMAQAADMLEADAQQSDQITGLQVAIRNLTEQPAAPQEPYELDQCDVERAKRCLEALRVVLGIDSPETRGWAPIVQQEARRAIDRALAALVEQTAQIQRLKSSVPQEPVRNDMSIQLLERLIKTLTNLGYATPEGGIEAFNADLPTQLYHLCFGVDRVLSALKTAVPQEPVAILNHAHGVHAIRSVNIAGLPDGEYKLFAAPQPQPRLTDAEILTLWAQTYVERGTSGIEFARVIEAKVRGEA